MKNKNFIPMILLAAFLMFSCTRKSEDMSTGKEGSKEKTETEEVKVDKDSLFKSASVTKIDVSKMTREELRKKINDVYEQYSKIRDELSDDDPEDIKRHTLKLRKTLLDIQTETVASGEYNSDWDNRVYQMESAALKMEMSKDLNEHRALFSDMSTVMENMIKNFGAYDKTLYKLTCTNIPDKPWLTDSKDLKNPYFGKEELTDNVETCIEITEAWEFD